MAARKADDPWKRCISPAVFSITPQRHPKSGALLSAALSFLIFLFHGFDQCMSKLIGTGGLLVTAGIAEQDIRRSLCAAAFEELSDRCQIARAAALKMKVVNETIFQVKGNFSCAYALRGEFEALHNDFSFQDHSHDFSLLYWRMGIHARKGRRVNIGKPVIRMTSQKVTLHAKT